MRKIILIVIAVAAISCHEDDHTAPEYRLGSIIAKRNGLYWNGSAAFVLEVSSDTLQISTSPGQGSFRMRIKFDGTGSYSLIKNQANYVDLLGGDVVISEYAIPENVVGHLTISKYNKMTQVIEGTFETTLQKKRGEPDLVDTMNFEGSFSGEIYNYSY
jgi:Family of unknown function (DUF6252)